MLEEALLQAGGARQQTNALRTSLTPAAVHAVMSSPEVVALLMRDSPRSISNLMDGLSLPTPKGLAALVAADMSQVVLCMLHYCPTAMHTLGGSNITAVFIPAAFPFGVWYSQSARAASACGHERFGRENATGRHPCAPTHS